MEKMVRTFFCPAKHIYIYILYIYEEMRNLDIVASQRLDILGILGLELRLVDLASHFQELALVSDEQWQKDQ